MTFSDARSYAKLGFSVIPINADNKRTSLHSWKEYQSRQPTGDELKSWFSDKKQRLAIIGGAVSGNLVIVDVDDLDLAAEIREDADFCKGQVIASTPSGGLHIYLKTRESIRSNPYGKGEIRAEGNYAVAPPSEGYRWEQSGPDKISLVDWADWWGRFTDRFDIGSATLRPTERIEDNRHVRLTRLAAKRRHQLEDDADDLYEYLRRYNAQKVSEPLSDSDIRRIADWAGSLTLRPALTDTGNALRLVDRNGAEIRYSEKAGWFVWTGQRWKPEARQRVRRMAIETAKAIKDEGKAEAIERWSRASQSSRAINAMVDLAQADERIEIEEDELDKDPFLLNVLNGTLDLRTGKLREHRPEDLITKLAPVAWDAHADGPAFKSFIAKVLPDRAIRQYVQRLLGYSLTGVVREQILPIWFGMGGNGKSTLKFVFLKIIGDYGMEAPRGFIDQMHREHSTELYDLRGTRAVFVSETERSTALAESLAKDLTGGERIRARRLYQRHAEFDPTHKLHLVTNYEPIVRGTDEGIWRRLKKVPFTVRITDAEKDDQLWEKLSQEHAFVLRWLVKGCLDWQREGLQEPAQVRFATDEYRHDSDLIGQFIQDCCVTGPKRETKTSALYQAYEGWARSNGYRPMASSSLGREMTRRGFKDFKSSNVRMRRGLEVRTLMVS